MPGCQQDAKITMAAPRASTQFIDVDSMLCGLVANTVPNLNGVGDAIVSMESSTDDYCVAKLDPVLQPPYKLDAENTEVVLLMDSNPNNGDDAVVNRVKQSISHGSISDQEDRTALTLSWHKLSYDVTLPKKKGEKLDGESF